MKCAWLCCGRERSGYRGVCAAGLRLKEHTLDAQAMNLAVRQIPVNRLSGTQAQQSATDRGQYRNPASHGICFIGVNQLDFTCRTGAFVRVDQAGVHGDHVLRNTIRWSYNGSIQLFGQVMISENFAQAHIIIQTDDQVAPYSVTVGCRFIARVDCCGFVSHNGACYLKSMRLISYTAGIRMSLLGIQSPHA